VKDQVERTTAWVYKGVWGVVTRWFRVPADPPTLPAGAGERLESFRPSEAFLRYLKFMFWIALLAVDIAIAIGWFALFAARPRLALLISPLALAVAVLPDIFAYIALHLRYDTTWYVMTNRSLRIRRGIWIIHETTITFENIQNIRVEQGPLQRYFGIADVVVETAGGGASRNEKGTETMAAHHGLIEGMTDAHAIRDRIMEIVRRSRSAGLGDERHEPDAGEHAWSPQHIAVLREIRDAVKALG
jgi:membrane protein YdbS with pleckstrin-like domain